MGCGNNCGGNNCFWIIILFIILFACGGNGFGCCGSGNSCSGSIGSCCS